MKRSITAHSGFRFILASLLMVLLLGSGLAMAEPTINWIGGCFPHDISADGSVVVGNSSDGAYEAFRWTADTGIVLLGLNPGSNGLSGAGTPDVSADGNHVSATIINPDTTGTTQGIWTKGEGWKWSMPPVPDGAGLGGDLGSCWGLSGDGRHLTGFVWFTGSEFGSAQGNTWSEDGGMNILAQPTPGGNYRVNDASYDGSVAVGWSANDFGTWRPTVWEDGGFTVLHDSDAWCEAEGVSADGNTVWGKSYNPLTDIREAAIWQRTDTGWEEQLLGALPGTFAGYGEVIVNDMTADGRTAVGYNAYDWYSSESFIWTLDQGMMAADDFLAAEGIEFPAGFVVNTITGISDNGVVLTGFGYNSAIYPQVWEAFVITRENVSPVPESGLPVGLRLEANYPNPFNPSTHIALVIDQAQDVRLGVYNAAGQLVKQLHSGVMSAGRNEFLWDGKDGQGRLSASGVYFARAQSETGETQSQRMVLVK